jgi:signal transduction histidine kinase
LALVAYLTTVFVITQGPNDDPVLRGIGEVPIGAFFVLAVGNGALFWRRSRPVAVLWVAVVASALSLGLGFSETAGVSVLIALYSVGRYETDQRWSYAALGGGFAFIGIDAVVEPVSVTEILGGLFVVFLVWYIGRRIRTRVERAAQLRMAQAAEARRVVAEERTRIARELHDVVAHRVSLMTVQAGAAKTVAGADPEGALRAMEAVEQEGRQALDELRQLLGILRPETGGDGLGPQPGLADVPRLVDHFANAGLDISLTMDGLPKDLPARVDLFAYRIVQEALTNVLRHAGPGARTGVRLGIDRQEIVVEVLDDGQGPTISSESGHGIIGMRERALLLGGSLEAGPRPGRGFRVVAHLPIGAEPA